MHGLSSTYLEGEPSSNGSYRPADAGPAAGDRRRDGQAAALHSAERRRDAAEASRDRFSFLAEVSRCLADSLDYEDTLKTVASMSLPYLDAWCIVDVLDDGGQVRRVAVLHPDPRKQEAARALHERFPPQAGDLIGAPRVIRSGRAEMVFDVPDHALQSAAHDAEHLALLRDLGVRAYVIVPMVARGRVLGAMTFVTAQRDRRFGDIDVVMAEDLARRAAMAVDNARLHAEAVEARDAADAALVEVELALEEATTAEEHLREARDAAEAALRTRDDFVATMTHEVQTPLNAILGYLQLLEMDVSGALVDTQRSYVHRAQESSQHLLRLVGDVLDFSRSETDRLAVAREEVDAADTARAAVALVGPKATGRLLTLHCGVDGTAGLRYLGDEYRVRQILVNLLSNAVKFTPAGGHVTLECREERSADARSLVFTVTDTGEGVKQDDAERIFEPFVQGAAGLTRPYGGTGLGLPISRRLARLMGGDVTLSAATAGAGASFQLRLPAAESRPPASGPGDAGDPLARSQGASTGGGADASRGLAAAAEALMQQIAPTVAEFVRRARADAELAFTARMSDVDVADHLGTLVIDISNSLAILAAAGGRPSELLADGSRIQRLIGELHGAQRQRMGWTEAQVVREVELVREVCLAAVADTLGGDDAARKAAAWATERLLDERTRACLTGFRGAAGAAG